MSPTRQSGFALVALYLAALVVFDSPKAHAATPTLTLEAVNWSGTTTVYRDPTTVYDATAYDQPEWTPARSYPVVYTRGMTPNGQIVVTVAGANGTFDVRGTGTHNFSILTNIPLTVGSGRAIQMACTTAVRPTVGKETAQINWEYRVTGGATNWLALQTNTITQFYVTLNNTPLDAYTYHSVLELACATGGSNTEDGTFSAIWGQFEDRNVRKINNVQLYYYYYNTRFGDNSQNLTGLLYSGTGQCGAWKSLMHECLNAHGIADMAQETSAYCTPANVSDYRFIVNNWSTNSPATGSTPYWWQVDSLYAAGCYDMQYGSGASDYGDLTSNSGIPGQGGATPSQKIFTNHLFLYNNNNAIYYDPSYGVTYVDSTDLVDNLFGFAKTCDSLGYYIDARLKSGSSGITFVP